MKHGKALAPLAALAGAWLLLLAAPAQAAAAEPSASIAITDHTELRLISAAAATGQAKELRLGLHFRLKPGWKVYWRSPGPGGYPPQVDWSGSENLAGVETHWPVPHRFSVLGFETLGYTDEVVYPMTATLVRPGQPLALRAVVDYLTCDEICVPYRAELALDVPAGPAATSGDSHLIDRFMAQIPGDGAAAGLTVERVTVRGPVHAPTLSIVARAREAFESPDVYIEGPEIFEFGAPELSLSDDRQLAVLTVGAGAIGETVPALAGKPLTLTLVDGSRAMETVAIPEAGASDAGADMAATWTGGLPLILALALLGGLILNLMPCVLPVLSIKLLGMVGHGGSEPRLVRRRFLASVAGILASFVVLAAGTVALKAVGLAAGWGIQFQQPAFLVAMVLILTLFAGNLWGLFDIGLPGRLAGLAAAGGGSKGLAGDFLTGAFATLLATPCSAPFLGTAVGFALARGALEIFAVFLALGLGLALPYLLVAGAPRLVTRLPRPGPWMGRLRQVLALALVATALWLLSVLAAQVGLPAALAVGALMLAALAVIALGRRLALRGAVPAALAVLALLAFLAPGLLPGTPWRGPSAPPSAQAGAADKLAWRPFDERAIAALVADGRTVFVDVTADWCITCQANKALVLERGEVARRLGAETVVTMQADWTRPDETIAAYLASYGRYGIPFNIVYGPGAPFGIALPELLTSEAVLAALERAGGGRETAEQR